MKDRWVVWSDEGLTFAGLASYDTHAIFKGENFLTR